MAALQAGRPVVLPLDTVYGLCASPYREDSARQIYELKQRPETQPTALVCSDLDMLFECLPELRGRSGILARALLPGPYTLVVPNPGHRYRWVTGLSSDRIGVRVPDLQGDAAEVLKRVGALIATSANVSGAPDPRRPEDVPEEMRRGVAAFLEAGELPGIPSTVLDLTGPEPKVLREGAVPAEEALARVAWALSLARH